MLSQSRLASPGQPGRMLSFAQYKARGTVEPTGYNAASERLPLHSWYALDHDKITTSIHKACLSLSTITSTRADDDTEMASLHASLDNAKCVSHSKGLCIAILGDQGIGKSSLACSIFDRTLVDISSSTSACTAFPTLITHKKGASDDSVESDVLFQFYNEEEILECAGEQGRRYRFAHPRKRRQNGTNLLWFYDDEYHDDDEEDQEEEDQGEEDQEEESETEKEQILNSARTAEEFFEIIFDAYERPERNRELQQELLYGDIEGGDFAATCVRYAKEHLTGIGAQDGFTKHNAVLDEDLVHVRAGAEKLWPLVKSVRVATGHRMLRNNLSFIDLPGYGDDNQIRTAIVEKFREMADFEIVVAPAERIVTSVAQNTYLNRSIRRLGAQNTLLVANKSDQLLNDLIPRGVNKIEIPPFPEAKKRLKESELLLRARREPRHIVDEYRRHVLKSPGSVYLQREEENIKAKLGRKGIDVEVRLVSARQYSLCLDAYSSEPPKITAEATGIPRLRQYLLELPARTNYETLQYHVYETLPDIVSQIQRVLTKFSEDAVYAEMREDIKTWIPSTRICLEKASELLVSGSVIKLWNSDQIEKTILAGIERLVYSLVHPTPYYATFLKIIKEKGIPVNGKGKGRNLNDEILRRMEAYILDWHDQMDVRITDLAASLEHPVQAVINQLRTHIENLTEHPDLKDMASNALETRARRIGMAQDKLRADLKTRLRATYAHYTTETHVHCPIALAMRPVYDSVLDVRGGYGAYYRHREHLHKCLCNPSAPMKNFAQVMATNIAEAQRRSWLQCCKEYATEAVAQLTEFRQIADELLDSGGYVKAEHRDIRDQLQTLLPEFQESLRQIQRACPHLEASVSNSSVVNSSVVNSSVVNSSVADPSDGHPVEANTSDSLPSAKRRKLAD